MLKILIVDDESLIRYSLSATFRDPSYQVQTAANGKDALRAIRDEVFDVCILDLHLPDMNGTDILQVLRATRPCTKVIVISGDTLNRETRKLVEENAILYLDKPFDLDQVRAVVNLLRDAPAGTEALPHEGRERRRYLRRTADTPVRYSAVAPGGEAKAIDLAGTLRDISDQGMQLFTDHPLQPGWWLLVSNGKTVHHGTVRWSREGALLGSFRIGVQISAPIA